MCLIKKHIFPKKSRKPITVYKVLKTDGVSLFPPYMSDGPINMGETYTGMDPFGNGHTVFNSIFKKEIEEGFIHSFNSLYTARKEAPYTFHHPTVIVECEIPANTFYYEGQFCDLASRKLKYVKIIEEL